MKSAIHAAIDDTIPITVGEEVIEPGMKVVPVMEFIRVPVKDRCVRCDFTPKGEER
jgi:hypothetical protein